MDQTTAAPRATPYDCQRCGYDLSGTSVGGACPECGHAVTASLARKAAEGAGTSGFAVWSLVLGILSITCLGALGVLAIIFGAVGIHAANVGRAGGSTRGQAIAGVVLGSIGLAISLFWWLWVLAVAAA